MRGCFGESVDDLHDDSLSVYLGHAHRGLDGSDQAVMAPAAPKETAGQQRRGGWLVTEYQSILQRSAREEWQGQGKIRRQAPRQAVAAMWRRDGWLP